MFTSTFELISLAASNSHILFCFCNLIIAILLIGTKPIFSFDRQVTIPPLATDGEGSHNMVDDDIKSIHGELNTQNVMVDDDDHERVDGDGDDVDGNQDVTTSNKEHNQDEEEGRGEEGRGEEDDHDGAELRRRVEEFINKIITELNE